MFDSIKSLIQMCQFSGLASISLNQDTNTWELNSTLKVISITWIIFSGAILILTFIFNDTFVDYENTKLQIVLFAMLISFSHFQAVFAQFESLLKRKQYAKLLNRLEHLDHLLRHYANIQIDYGRVKKATRRFIIFWFAENFFLVFGAFYLYWQVRGSYTMGYLCMLLPSYAVSKLSYAYSMMLVSIIYENIDALSKYLKSSIKQNGYYLSETYLNRDNFKYKKWHLMKTSRHNLNADTLLQMKLIYSEIWEATRSISDLNYYSFPFGIANDLFVLTFIWFWIFLIVYNQLHISSYYTFLCIFITNNLTNILIIAHHCSQITEAVSSTHINLLNHLHGFTEIILFLTCGMCLKMT